MSSGTLCAGVCEMAETLTDILIRHIRDNGPISVSHFMGLALGHPQYGYYMNRDPFGRLGDFVTAPEISQLFGEMIGVWMADLWLRMGAPSPFLLVESGPGRGTLMADLLRATRKVDGFHTAMQIHLIETSPSLRTLQAHALAGHAPYWHDSIDTLPDDAPILFVANEFLDALPIIQLMHGDKGWAERVIGLSDDGQLMFGLAPADPSLVAAIPDVLDPRDGNGIYEVSPARSGFTALLSERIERQGGAALFIDYGHSHHGMGDTLQAMRGHKFVSVFDDVGTADITSHVDFEAVAEAAIHHGASVYGPVEQWQFLEDMGIRMRASHLINNAADEKQADDVRAGLERLVSPDQMGALFKVLAIGHDAGPTPSGFGEDITP